MVEFALAIPFLLLVLVAIVYFGRYFFTAQSLLYAAQEGCRFASRIPHLSDPQVRDAVRGFSSDGAVIGPDDPAQNPSPVYAALSAAKMLSGPDRAHGNLPPGASISILPFDGQETASDTVTVLIRYPFGFSMDWSTGKNSGDFGDSLDIAVSGNKNSQPVSFGSFTIEESATAAQEIYQE